MPAVTATGGMHLFMSLHTYFLRRPLRLSLHSLLCLPAVWVSPLVAFIVFVSVMMLKEWGGGGSIMETGDCTCSYGTAPRATVEQQ